ncbi:para-nitrobenzyl esterase [Pseudomonas sp. ok272]|uniref:carboxylesterase/lipase family protein n=1 Tax=unclassified Pseudomonas TaxID=196821 RepID=UPI0008AA85A1|nr:MULTISPECIES: carboxylesterase family protein [unclassified Pseudomonas]SEN11405.1 para-nitrobenzyl esterase [Pseudomonas sp. ok272]SFN04482.1 para-nitrobenzyl esterase [Pseudomonas sp. ok602]
MAFTSTHPATVHTEQGSLRGAFDATCGLHGFFGIPYAEPPLGALRFRPPQAHRGWTGVRAAERFGCASAQLFDSTEGEFCEFSDSEAVEGQPWVGAEDCLTLNVWTPSVGPVKRPVIVWIHGGANWLESSRLKCYHGDVLAKTGDAVFVSFNYRLGVFGFLDVSVLGDDSYAGAHSHGVLDQLEALRWVRRNIQAFGGDPQNITLMGESAGSIDISWLLAGGHLGGLVKRVVMMSGYAGLPGLSGDIREGLSDASAGELARQFFADCAIDSVEQLQQMSTAQVMMKVHHLAESSDMLFRMDALFWPKTCAHSSPVDPIAFAEQGRATGIEVMIGFTHYEMGLWLNWDETLDHLGLDRMVERLDIIPPALKDAAKALYRQTFPDEDEGQRAMHLLGDCVFVMPSLWAAEGLSKGNAVKVYRFDRETDPRRRAQHAADQVYFFGKLDTYVGRLLAGTPRDDAEQVEREALASLMQGLILSFAGAAATDSAAYRDWVGYDGESRTLLALDTQPQMLSDPYRQRRAWWFEHIYRG